MAASSYLARAVIFLLLFLSPVGAPVIGALIGHVCPKDGSASFPAGFAYCGIDRTVEQLYQHFAMLSLMPVAVLGPLLGLLIAMIWWLLGLSCLAACGWHLWRGVAARLSRR